MCKWRLFDVMYVRYVDEIFQKKKDQGKIWDFNNEYQRSRKCPVIKIYQITEVNYVKTYTF